MRCYLRPFKEEDLRRLAAWLKQPHVSKWYTEPEDWMEEVRERKGSYAWLHHMIVMVGQTPIGFCQYYDCYHAKDLEIWYDAPRPGEQFSIDYLIGEVPFLGKGYGKAVVSLLTERVRKEGGRRIVVQPEEENLASRGALTANGFRYEMAKAYFIKVLALEPM